MSEWINSLVYNFLNEQDPKLGEQFQKETNPPPLPDGSPSITEIYQFYKQTSSSAKRKSEGGPEETPKAKKEISSDDDRPDHKVAFAKHSSQPSAPTGREGYDVGDLVWARIAGASYHPAIVTEDPHYKFHTKIVNAEVGTTNLEPDAMEQARQYHIQFLGDRKRMWLTGKLMLAYKGITHYENLAISDAKNIKLYRPKTEGMKSHWRDSVLIAKHLETLETKERIRKCDHPRLSDIGDKALQRKMEYDAQMGSSGDESSEEDEISDDESSEEDDADTKKVNEKKINAEKMDERKGLKKSKESSSDDGSEDDEEAKKEGNENKSKAEKEDTKDSKKIEESPGNDDSDYATKEGNKKKSNAEISAFSFYQNMKISKKRKASSSDGSIEDDAGATKEENENKSTAEKLDEKKKTNASSSNEDEKVKETIKSSNTKKAIDVTTKNKADAKINEKKINSKKNGEEEEKVSTKSEKKLKKTKKEKKSEKAKQKK